ncbi:hypothetical protein [Paenibacillus amylolyticus]|uniref:hypothetical protein n=1 Tax=Paenibacillus amylolyticus TaxID=1451 RepID=UPI003EB9FF23
MEEKNKFHSWLTDNTKLSESTKVKYTAAINTISEGLKQYNLIESNLYYIKSSTGLIAAQKQYFKINEFSNKDEKGNRMYSNAFKYFIEYRRDL